MWTAMAKQKNSYLHKVLDKVDPRVVNRSVCRATIGKVTDQDDMYPPCHRPTCLQPECFAPNVDPSKAQVAYGLWGIPRLILDMRDNYYKRRRAITALNDELCDPEKCLRAIEHYQIVKRLGEVLHHHLKHDSDFYPVERMCLNFVTIATHLNGALRMFQEIELQDDLYSIIEDLMPASVKAACALATQSSHLIVSKEMISNGHLQKVKEVLDRIKLLPEVYILLGNLIERQPSMAIKEGYFSILLPLVQKGSESLNCRPQIMKCFALLINCKKGQKLCDLNEHNVVEMLYDIMKNENKSELTLEYAAMALCNCTFSTRSRWRCREFWDLPVQLIRRAHSKNRPRLQIHCLQALRQICEMPSVKEFVRKVCKKKIKNICCLTPLVEQYKRNLLAYLRYRPYRHHSPIEERDIITAYEHEDTQILSGLEDASYCSNDEISQPSTPQIVKDFRRSKQTPSNLCYRLDMKPVEYHYESPLPSKPSFECLN